MKSSEEIRPVEVYAGTSMQATIAQSLLENEGIMAFLKDDNMGTIAPWQVSGGGAGAVKVFVSSKDYEEARELIEQADIK